ncbi:MAG: murein biosynthesis integral membrane protein MurJ [Candidatus Pelagibacterales bacterium]|nr:MAG: murein biosynthesis integral membrane protein MurJ [Pelagibacterales bacterium]|tara:strand:+ start:1987 stop:3516 length:1530 start_codon:yes stop_codon:yes gene_type:complete
MNLFKSTTTFSFFTILSRILGYIRDILIAIFLGSGILADTFFVAFRIPNTFRRLFSEGSFNSAFVPSYASELSKGKSQANNFANDIYNFLVISLFSLVLLIEIFMPYFVFLIAPGFSGDEEKMQLVINLTRITFPFLFFISISSFFSAILNSHNRFAAAAAAPIILNIVLITTLFFAKLLDDKLVYYLSYAVTFSGIIQFIFLYIVVKKFYISKFKFKFKLNEKVRFFFKKLLPSIFSSGVVQINILVGTIIASFQASAVSYLYYADRIYQINLAIAGVAISTVILPKLSSLVDEQNNLEIKNIQNKALELSFFLSFPAAVALLIASEPTISSLFGYGSFSQTAVENSSKALFYFAFGLPAFAMIKVFSSFFFARHDTKTPFLISIFSVFSNIFISLIFFQKIGFIILPIATSISSWINAILLYIFMRKKDLFKFNDLFKFRFPRIVFASICMGVILYFILDMVSLKIAYDQNLKAFYLLCTFFISLISYFLISYFIKAFKISDIKIRY